MTGLVVSALVAAGLWWFLSRGTPLRIAPVAAGHWLERYVRADGSIDFAAAHAAWFPDLEHDNLAIDLLLALGPGGLRPDGPVDPVLAGLGLADLRSRGPFYVCAGELTAADLSDAGDPAELEHQRGVASKQPWRAELQPLAERWLERNAAVLERLENSTATRCALPWQAPPAAMLDMVRLRELMDAYTALAFRAVAAGDVATATRHVAFLHRLGVALSASPTVVSAVVGTHCFEAELRPVRALLHDPQLDLAPLRAWAGDAGAVEPPSLALAIDYGERLDQMANAGTNEDMAVVRRMMNDELDQVVRILGTESYAKHRALEQEHQRQVAAAAAAHHFDGSWHDRVLLYTRSPSERRRLVDEVLGRALIHISTPNLLACDETDRRARVRLRLMRLAIALRSFRDRTGQWPETLDAVVGPDLERLPTDPFGDGPLLDERTADGWRLRSRGKNGEDDGGRAETDDVVLQVP